MLSTGDSPRLMAAKMINHKIEEVNTVAKMVIAIVVLCFLWMELPMTKGYGTDDDDDDYDDALEKIIMTKLPR